MPSHFPSFLPPTDLSLPDCGSYRLGARRWSRSFYPHHEQVSEAIEAPRGNGAFISLFPAADHHWPEHSRPGKKLQLK